MIFINLSADIHNLKSKNQKIQKSKNLNLKLYYISSKFEVFNSLIFGASKRIIW
jgi:hypothetical protein